MKQTYQGGYLRRTKRKAGPDRWEYLWREKDESGVVRRRTAIVGTLEQYPNEQAALSAVNGLRMQINADLFRQRHRPILVRDLIDHYVQTDLSLSRRGGIRSRQGRYTNTSLKNGCDRNGKRAPFGLCGL